MSNRVYKGFVTKTKTEEIKRAWTQEELTMGVMEAFEYPDQVPRLTKTTLTIEIDYNVQIKKGDTVFIVGKNYVETVVDRHKTPDIFEATGQENLDGAEKRFALINEELKKDK